MAALEIAAFVKRWLPALDLLCAAVLCEAASTPRHACPAHMGTCMFKIGCVCERALGMLGGKVHITATRLASFAHDLPARVSFEASCLYLL